MRSMRTRASSSSISSSTRTKPPHFLMGLLGREAETYADAYLVSQEGKMFPVVRSLLAMKCSFFKEKFFPGSIERKSHSDGDPETDAPENFSDDMDMQAVYAPLEGTPRADKTGQIENLTPAVTAGTASPGPERSSAPATMDRSLPLSNGEAIPSTEKDEATVKIEPSEASAVPQAAQDTTQASSEQHTERAAQGTGQGQSEAEPSSIKSGSFQVSNGNGKPRYPMPFPMILLKQVVEFIYTDSVTFLDDIEVAMKPWRAAPNATYSPCPPTCTVVSHIIELARAADYVELKELCLRCCVMLRMVVKAKRSTACAALGAIRRKKDNPFFLNKMASLLVKYINGDVKKSFCIAPCSRSHASGQEASCECFGAFGLCTVMHLNRDALEEVICAQARGFSDEYMLQVVYFWATGGKRFTSLHSAGGLRIAENNTSTTDLDGSTGNFDDIDSDQNVDSSDFSPLSDAGKDADPNPIQDVRDYGIPLVYPKAVTPPAEARFDEGKSMTLKFNLSEMNPSFLYEYVENSGLVDKETLYNVYRYRALSGPRFTRMFSIRKRSVPPPCDQSAVTEE